MWTSSIVCAWHFLALKKLQVSPNQSHTILNITVFSSTHSMSACDLEVFEIPPWKNIHLDFTKCCHLLLTTLAEEDSFIVHKCCARWVAISSSYLQLHIPLKLPRPWIFPGSPIDSMGLPEISRVTWEVWQGQKNVYETCPTDNYMYNYLLMIYVFPNKICYQFD